MFGKNVITVGLPLDAQYEYFIWIFTILVYFPVGRGVYTVALFIYSIVCIFTTCSWTSNNLMWLVHQPMIANIRHITNINYTNICIASTTHRYKFKVPVCFSRHTHTSHSTFSVCFRVLNFSAMHQRLLGAL